MGNFTSNNRPNDVSSTIPYLERMTKDAQTLVKQLKAPEAEDLVFTETENYSKYQIFEQNQQQNQNNDNLSDTSPFITEDFYNKMVGNTKATVQKQSGGGNDDSSSTSDSNGPLKTTDDNEADTGADEDTNMDLEDMDGDQGMEESMESMIEDMEESEVLMSTGSYLSSSAHTDGIENSSQMSTVSVGNSNVLSESINTSDINMISIEE